MIYDLAVIGGGPAGSTCAALCAEAGLRVLLIERAVFPRDKVCGDCMNPSCWPVLEKLGVADAVRASVRGQIERVEIAGMDESRFESFLPPTPHGEFSIKRSVLDELLLTHASKCGVEVRTNTTLQALEKGWRMQTSQGVFSARRLVAADGRNSSVARLLGLLPAAQKDRVALQTHFPLPRSLERTIVLRFLREGYCGLADIGNGEANLCLVARPKNLAAIRQWAEAEFALPSTQSWQSITPLSRRPISPAHENLLLIGDAARVVEPFTGEGIYYALATGNLAAEFLINERPLADFPAAQRRLYRGRLWINGLARQACLHPRLATWAIHIFPKFIQRLTSKVTGHMACFAVSR